MAITTEYSTEFASAVNNNTAVKVDQWHGRLRVMTFEFTQGSVAGDAGSLAVLGRLPAGNVRVILPLSFIGTSAMGVARTMDIGWLAYTQRDGSAVTADPNGLDDGIDVSSAATTTPGGTLGGGENKEFDNEGGVDITAQINDDTIPAAATIQGFLVYVVD